MHAPVADDVVQGQSNEEREHADYIENWKFMNSGYARERRADDADTREEHQPLVCLGSPPQIYAARGENRKVEEGGDVCANKPWQLRGAQAVRRRSRDRANIHHQTHDDHDDGQYRARDTQASMDVRVAGRDERSLNEEQHKPGRQYDAMDMQQCGERLKACGKLCGSEVFAEKEGSRKAGQNNGEQGRRHADKKPPWPTRASVYPDGIGGRSYGWLIHGADFGFCFAEGLYHLVF
jgi:hypothetical protein